MIVDNVAEDDGVEGDGVAEDDGAAAEVDGVDSTADGGIQVS